MHSLELKLLEDRPMMHMSFETSKSYYPHCTSREVEAMSRSEWLMRLLRPHFLLYVTRNIQNAVFTADIALLQVIYR